MFVDILYTRPYTAKSTDFTNNLKQLTDLTQSAFARSSFNAQTILLLKQVVPCVSLQAVYA